MRSSTERGAVPILWGLLSAFTPGCVLVEIPLDRPSGASEAWAPCPDLSGSFEVIGEASATREFVWLLPVRWHRVEPEPTRLDQDLGLMLDRARGRPLSLEGTRAIAISHTERDRLEIVPLVEGPNADPGPPEPVTFVRDSEDERRVLEDRARAFRCKEGALAFSWHGGGFLFRNYETSLSRLPDGSLGVEVGHYEGIPFLYYAWRWRWHRYEQVSPTEHAEESEGP